MTPTPQLVRALLERNQRELWRMGEIPPASETDDLEMMNRRAIAERLQTEIEQFENWLSRHAAARTTV